ncbi:hypothetical protein GW915_04325 [bacterium]|nr:hypothetical protein [bacterium]
MFFVFKTIVSGLLVAGASVLARKYPGPAGIFVALPVTTFLTMAWMGIEGTQSSEMAVFLRSVGWITVAGLGVFFLTPWLLKIGWSFWPAFGVGLLTLFAGSWIAYRYI